MLHFSRVTTIFILLFVTLGFVLALPNGLPVSLRQKLPAPLQRTINIGLDLQGGAHLLLEVDIESVLEKALENESQTLKQALAQEGRIRTSYMRIENRAIVGKFRHPEDVQTGMAALRATSALVNPTVFGVAKTTQVTQVGTDGFRVEITQENIDAITRRTVEQSIEVLRRRIDPTGTTEMTLAREGRDRILLQVPGAKNVDEIKDRINKSANLSFHMVRPESNSERALALAEKGRLPDVGAAYYPASRGSPLIVEKRTNITGECLKSASEGLHPQGNYPVVNFIFNIRCAKIFGALTAKNIGKRFAVILDDEIITAPNINGAIPGGRGFIEGGFTLESARELALLLNAGALPAKLVIVEERTVGPDLGQDAIQAGKMASIIGLAGVVLCMLIFYGLRFGLIANLTLLTNICLIVATLSFLGATLTLPGIAGIILTIGMAVDANVLIFERIREETYRGRPPVNAIDTGYRRSLAPILDANITTLIAAITLYFVGSGPIRGFAVTLAIGIIMSVFAAMVFGRFLVALWLRSARATTLPI